MVIVSLKFNDMPAGSIVERDIPGAGFTYEVTSEPYTDRYGDTVFDMASIRTGEEWQAYPQYYRVAV